MDASVDTTRTCGTCKHWRGQHEHDHLREPCDHPVEVAARRDHGYYSPTRGAGESCQSWEAKQN